MGFAALDSRVRGNDEKKEGQLGQISENPRSVANGHRCSAGGFRLVQLQRGKVGG